MKKAIFSLICAFFAIGSANALPLTGFYQTIDDSTHKPKSIVRLYECGENLCGRIVALYDQQGNGTITETLNKPIRVADKVTGSPKMAGLDILWDMKWDENDKEYSDGRIMDPKKGSVYRSIIWQEEKEINKLHVRGKIGPFGRTQTWNVMQVKDLPKDIQNLDIKNWKPVVVE